MPKQPRIPVIATGATRAVLQHPAFPQVLDNWKEVAGRIIVVTPQGVQCPEIKKVRFQQISRDIPSLGDVVQEMTRGMDYVANRAALVDPFTVLKWDVFQMDAIAERRHLSLSWMATSHPMRLADFDTPTGMDETRLAFFCAPESIWSFLVTRFLEDAQNVPFISPAWSGWMGHWSTQHVHTHKYHDLSDLGAVGVLEDVPEEEVSLEGIGKLTFNAPIRNYVTKAVG